MFTGLLENLDSKPCRSPSNKAFADWNQVFVGDAIMASAALDSLLHRSTVINIRGDSYRLKEKRQANASLEPKEVIAQPTA